MERKPQLERGNVVGFLHSLIKTLRGLSHACIHTYMEKKSRDCVGMMCRESRERQRHEWKMGTKVERGRDTGIEIKLHSEE